MTVRRVLPVACALMLVAAVALMPYGCSSSSPTQPGTNRALSVSGEIAAVNSTARTFTLVSDSRTYKVQTDVSVQFYGLPDSTAPTLEVLHPGDGVAIKGTESVTGGGTNRTIEVLVSDLIVTQTADGHGDSIGGGEPPPPPPPPDSGLGGDPGEPPPPPPPYDSSLVDPYTGQVLLHFRIAPTEWPSNLALLVLEMETVDSMSCPNIPILDSVVIPDILSLTTEIGVVIKGIPQYECFRYDPAPATAYHAFPVATNVAYTIWFRNGDLTDSYQVTVAPDNSITVTPSEGSFTKVATVGGWSDPVHPPVPPDTGHGEPPPPPPPPDSGNGGDPTDPLPINGMVLFSVGELMPPPDSPFVNALWWAMDLYLETEEIFGCTDLPIYAVDSWTEESAGFELLGTPRVACPAVLIAPATLERRLLFKSRTITLTFTNNGMTDVFKVDRDPANGLTVSPAEGQFMRLRP